MRVLKFDIMFNFQFYERIKNEVKERKMLMSNKGKGVFNTKQKGSLSDIFDKKYGPSSASVKQYGPGAIPVEPPYLIATCGSGLGIIQVTSKKSQCTRADLFYL